MTAPDDWPGALDLYEAEIDHEIGERRRSTISDIPIWETDADLDELYLALQDAERRRDAADALADMCESGAYEDEFNRATYEAARIQDRIDELEDREARAAEHELRRDYRQSVL